MERPLVDKDQQRLGLMDKLFREHYAEIHIFLASKVRQADIADDLTSIVFLKALRWLLEDRGIRQARNWLYAAARTTLADYWQEQQRYTSFPLEKMEEHSSGIPEQTEQKRIQQQVQQLLSLLPERERQVLLLRYIQGYTAAEVGRELGLNAGHVRVLQLRALRQAARFTTAERQLSQMERIALPYTLQGQRVLDLAKDEALALKQYYIGPEHLLLGILAEGSAATPLFEQGITLEHVRAGLIFLVGKEQGDAEAGAPLTPQAQHILAEAEQQAQEHGEVEVSSQRLLAALRQAEDEYGITYGLLQLLGVEPAREQKSAPGQDRGTSALGLEEYLLELAPTLSPEEERQLAHTVLRAEKERKRAAYRGESGDSSLLEEGRMAYYQLFMACQPLVIAIAKEYLVPGKDAGKLLEAGNRGLTYAISYFGLKTQVSFRSYASHWIHLEIMERVLERW